MGYMEHNNITPTKIASLTVFALGALIGAGVAQIERQSPIHVHTTIAAVAAGTLAVLLLQRTVSMRRDNHERLRPRNFNSLPQPLQR